MAALDSERQHHAYWNHCCRYVRREDDASGDLSGHRRIEGPVRLAPRRSVQRLQGIRNHILAYLLSHLATHYG